jgi:hypothetical protein
VYKIYFWVSYCRPWFLWPETKKLVIPFLCIYLIASLLSVHCVSPHRRSHKPHRISTLKTKYHLLWLPPWPQPIIEDGSSIQGRVQDGAKIEDFKYLSEGKIFPVPTLSLSPLCPRTSKRLSMGEEVGTMRRYGQDPSSRGEPAVAAASGNTVQTVAHGGACWRLIVVSKFV